MPPLDTVAVTPSDHRCVYVRSEFLPSWNYTWIARYRRTRTKTSEDAFASLLRD